MRKTREFISSLTSSVISSLFVLFFFYSRLFLSRGLVFETRIQLWIKKIFFRCYHESMTLYQTMREHYATEYSLEFSSGWYHWSVFIDQDKKIFQEYTLYFKSTSDGKKFIQFSSGFSSANLLFRKWVSAARSMSLSHTCSLRGADWPPALQSDSKNFLG